MMNQRTVEASGAPLAVCINDCQIDCGQEASELAPVCFQVGCAFAGMRWGSLIDANAPRPTLKLVAGGLRDPRSGLR
jgi:hypothetical protein